MDRRVGVVGHMWGIMGDWLIRWRWVSNIPRLRIVYRYMRFQGWIVWWFVYIWWLMLDDLGFEMHSLSIMWIMYLVYRQIVYLVHRQIVYYLRGQLMYNVYMRKLMYSWLVF